MSSLSNGKDLLCGALSRGGGGRQPQTASPRYEHVQEIGKGAYSAVYKGRDRWTEGRYVAMKEVRIPIGSEEGIPMTTVREIGLLRQLDKFEHPNVVRLFDVVSAQRTHHELHLMLIFEHVDQDLAQYLERNVSGLSPEHRQNIFRQILKGVDFIHSHRIVHRDLKPQNILITADGCVKLADFGLARIYGFSMALTSVVVTLYYRAPEVLLQDQYCAAVDIWSCACIFAELHTRRPLFPGQSEMDQLCKIFEVIGMPPESDWPATVPLPRCSFKISRVQPLESLVPNMDPEALDLMKEMLLFKQTSRISAQEALRSHYFADVSDGSATAASDTSTLSSFSSSSRSSSTSQPDGASGDEFELDSGQNDDNATSVQLG